MFAAILAFVVAVQLPAPPPQLAPELEREAKRLETKLIAYCCWSQQVSVHDSPAATQMLYRIGDSSTYIVTPLMTFFALVITIGAIFYWRESDLIVVDEGAPWQISAEAMRAKAGNTPFDGLPVQGRVLRVMKGGMLA